ncbi:MAG: DUF3098 domain-containing protein [Bacteroidales bacterium]|nr:DUF3098 domain-containing protein [Bacteroidales bacterium]
MAVNNERQGFALDKTNYILIAVGLVIIIIGFMLLAGGKADSPDVFNPEVFSVRRITIAPLVILAGFVFEIYAIMKKPK